MIVLAAGLDDLDGGGIPELMWVEGLKNLGMGCSVDASLLGAVGGQGPIGALLQALLEGPACRKSSLTLSFEVSHILLKLPVTGLLELLKVRLHILDYALVPLRVDLRRNGMCH